MKEQLMTTTAPPLQPRLNANQAIFVRTGQLLTACPRCERIRLETTWLEPAAAISRLRTFNDPYPPQFAQRTCPDCVARITARKNDVQHSMAHPAR
jgi:hypothetical protein